MKKVKPLPIRFTRLALFAAMASLASPVERTYAQMSASGPSVDAANTTSSSPTKNAATAGKSAYEITKDEVVDTLITAKLKTALYEDKATSGKDIHVATRDHVVTLWGDVPNTEIAKRAEDLARSTNGVHDVVNMLRLNQSNG